MGFFVIIDEKNSKPYIYYILYSDINEFFIDLDVTLYFFT